MHNMFNYGFFSDDEMLIRECIWGRVITFFCVFAIVGVVGQWLVNNNYQCHQIYINDFIATFVTYGCTIGHGYLGNVYGPLATLSSQLVVGVGLVWMLNGSANPLPQVMTLVTSCDRQQSEMLTFRILANLVAGFASHPFSRMLWLQLNHDMNPRYIERLHCVAPVNVSIGVGSEFIGTLVVCSFFASSVACYRFEIYELAVRLVLEVFLQAVGISHCQSVHLNPALAGSHSFNCGRTTDVSHGLIIHSIASIAAAAVYTQYGLYCQYSPCYRPPPCPDPCYRPECGPMPRSCPTPCPPQCAPPCANPCPTACCDPCGPPCSDKITAQVKQSKDEDGKRKVDYVVYFPPMCTEKGIRLRHKFVIDKDQAVQDANKAQQGKTASKDKDEDKSASKHKEKDKPKDK